MRGGLARIIWTRSILEIIDAQSRRTRGKRQGTEQGCEQEECKFTNQGGDIRLWSVTLHGGHSALCLVRMKKVRQFAPREIG